VRTPKYTTVAELKGHRQRHFNSLAALQKEHMYFGQNEAPPAPGQTSGAKVVVFARFSAIVWHG
jgi:hypothetical protein